MSNNPYHEWGFRQNPFSTTPLTSSDIGIELLVGRDKEIKNFLIRLNNSPNIIPIEGANGIGKTSLINVAFYYAYREYKNSRMPLFLPCDEIFQLSQSVDKENFIDAIYFGIAQTITKKSQVLKEHGFSLSKDLHQIDVWLNDAIQKGFDITIGSFGGGVSSGLNETIGFMRSGFRIQMKNILQNLFGDEEFGSIVLVIDNIELAQRSANAKQILEEFRDTIFALPNTKWILSGSLGIIRSIISSPRLEGLMHKPIELQGVEKSTSEDIIISRINVYAEDRSSYYLPIVLNDFSRLYSILNKNIRNALAYTHEYCLSVYENTVLPSSDSEKEHRFDQWLINEGRKVLDSLIKKVSSPYFQFFKKITEVREITFSNYDMLECASIEEMEEYCEVLQVNGLIEKIETTENRASTSILVTPKGWLLLFTLEKLHAEEKSKNIEAASRKDEYDQFVIDDFNDWIRELSQGNFDDFS